MPTIEIASLNATQLGLDQEDFDIAIMEESKLESHRSLFYDFLKSKNGAIVHIGNPNFKDDKKSFFYAGALIDWNWNTDIPDSKERKKSLKSNAKNGYANQTFLFKFKPECRSDLDRLLLAAIHQSPDKTLFFLTDYQFGPEKAEHKKLKNVAAFWQEHDDIGLRFNTLYEIGTD